MNDDRSRLKICLVASGGGHLRQISQLRPLYEKHDAFLVTQETPLGTALSKETKTYFIPDVALGKIKRDPRGWGAYLGNLFQSFRILRKERPDVVLSTGAGLAFNLLALARLFRIKTLFLESIAHVYTPTATGRLVSRWADAYLVQWEDLHRVHPGSIPVCPIRVREDSPSKSRRPGGTFVTVGTHGPFPRLIEAVDRLAAAEKIPRPIVVQHPEGTPCPHADRVFAGCTVEEFRNHLHASSLVIAHAGTGSIFSAIEAGCKVIAIPRLARYGEHYDDHQKEILRKLTELGAILGSERIEDLEDLALRAADFQPKSIEYDSSVIADRIEEIFSRWFDG